MQPNNMCICTKSLSYGEKCSATPKCLGSTLPLLHLTNCNCKLELSPNTLKSWLRHTCNFYAVHLNAHNTATVEHEGQHHVKTAVVVAGGLLRHL